MYFEERYEGPKQLIPTPALREVGRYVMLLAGAAVISQIYIYTISATMVALFNSMRPLKSHCQNACADNKIVRVGIVAKITMACVIMVVMAFETMNAG